MNILIRGGGWVNKGGEAMLCTTQKILSSKLQGARFFAGLPPKAQAYGATECFSPLPELHGGRADKIFHLGKTLKRCPVLIKPLFNDRWATTQAIAAVEQTDAMLDVSGFAYSDEWGTGYAARTWTYALYSNCLKKPYVFMPQSWGPFENRALRRLTIDLIRWSSLVCVRDQKSLSHIEELFGEMPSNVRLAPDVAFEFKSAPLALGKVLIDSLGLRGDKSTLLGIAPNMRVFERMAGHGAENRYVQLLAEVIRWGQDVGASIILIPHEISFASKPNDDRYLCRLIKNAVGDNDSIAVLDGLYSAAEVKSVVSHLDMLVGSRFHSIVAALSSGVPPVVLGWSHKYIELMRSVGLEKLVLDYDQADFSSLVERIDSSWKDKDELSRQLHLKLPEVKAEVDGLFNLIADLLEGFRE